MVLLTNSVCESINSHSSTVLEHCAPLSTFQLPLKPVPPLKFRTNTSLCLATPKINVKRNYFAKQSFLETLRKFYRRRRSNTTTGTCNITNKPLTSRVSSNRRILVQPVTCICMSSLDLSSTVTMTLLPQLLFLVLIGTYLPKSSFLPFEMTIRTHQSSGRVLHSYLKPSCDIWVCEQSTSVFVFSSFAINQFNRSIFSSRWQGTHWRFTRNEPNEKVSKRSVGERFWAPFYLNRWTFDNIGKRDYRIPTGPEPFDWICNFVFAATIYYWCPPK